ncbi:hypothetical protein K2173_001357 [Erythroxylum novogranatense]|uniref:Subtilisin-like protease SBT5.6 n=1 Tax=Erythroxylum novogranatense TaxID=1862640 RepID=A0AAV8T3I2_9ROSI|nr:hypothetical protein K2173_001357 [Erythroxylum novogranatense]
MKSIFIFFPFLLPHFVSCAETMAYVVYFGGHKGDKALDEIEATHHSYLQAVKETEEEAKASFLYSYKHTLNGFAALLTPDEAFRLSEMEEVISVFRNEAYSLQTTRSWEFVGLKDGQSLNHPFGSHRDLLPVAGYGKNIIIGIMDSGVWPESPSFSDEGMEPIPRSWKGICQTGVAFNKSHCNSKIIGARYYIKAFEQEYGPLNATEDYRSPRDTDGHGSHCSSIAAGRVVPGAAALGGFASGTAYGGAPLARLSIYKACWATPNQEKAVGNTCFGVDMLAALDDAVADGVDVLSLSIATAKPYPYEGDAIAIGAFHAVQKNVIVVAAAGNTGPAPSTLSNNAPWILTVAASTLDREFFGSVLLGNGKEIRGQTITPYKRLTDVPVVLAEDVVGAHVHKDESNQCLPNSLDPEKVKGKIVLCMRGLGIRVGKSFEVKRAGGAGFILGNTPAFGGEHVIADPHFLPGTAVGAEDAIKIINYIKYTKNPLVTLEEPRTVLNQKPAPCIAAFSGRGPSPLDSNILKPDIAAPGVYILAAWSGGSSPTKYSFDHRSVKFNFDTGTSMATPHVAGAAALVRAVHPHWSSAAIKSALITTAGIRNNLGNPITDQNGNLATPFEYGAGHFRPARASDPGLVYDSSFVDYVLYLCNYGSSLIKGFRCPERRQPTNTLNYPSLAISKLSGSVTVKRTVTNVGAKNSVYFFTAKPPLGISVESSHNILLFNRVGQKRDFTITVKATDDVWAKKYYKNGFAFGWYSWKDNYHNVRSPVVVSLA